MGIGLVPFETADKVAVHAVMLAAYAGGGGRVGTFEAWWNGLIADDEYDPRLCFVAVADRATVGFCQCWTSAFIKDLVVAPEFAGQGIGRALLLTALAAFEARGAASVDLKVEAGNHRALGLYRALGFVPT